MSNFNSADIAAFKDVWVFCEQREGKLMPTDFELISKGRDLADELGVHLCGLLLGGEGIESAAKELGGYGADKVIVCEHPLLATYTTDAYAKVICDVIEELKPEAFSDSFEVMDNFRQMVADKLKGTLLVGVKVKLVEPGGIERSVGKTKHVRDLRK